MHITGNTSRILTHISGLIMEENCASETLLRLTQALCLVANLGDISWTSEVEAQEK